jgi:hypothetical protein
LALIGITTSADANIGNGYRILPGGRRKIVMLV